MAFWGVEVKPGKPFTHLPSCAAGRLHISQATMGGGSAMQKCLVQCNVGNKTPVLLCCLVPDRTESCLLNLEFDECDEVIFSVIGSRSIHLTGYYLDPCLRPSIDNTESYGEDIADTETEASMQNGGEDKYEDSFIDDDDEPEAFPHSPISSTKDQKFSTRRLQKKYKVSKSEDSPLREPILLNQQNSPCASGSERERSPISLLCEKRSERKITESIDEKADVCADKSNDMADASDHHTVGERAVDAFGLKRSVENNHDDGASRRVKGRKKKKDKSEGLRQFVDTDNNAKMPEIRSLSNGLSIEEIRVGEIDGKVAAPRKKVSVHYIGRLKENEQIIDSNIGKDPFRFRLGKGLVIEGWEIGIEGMRVGGKRKLTIPPSMGFGSGGGANVPPNSWLLYEIELVAVH